MLSIRLSRTGKRKQPYYRLVIQDKRHDPWSSAIENLGTYNPHTDPPTANLKVERVQYWLSQGAQASETVHNILVNAGVIKGEKAKAVTISKKRQEKINAKKAEAEAQRAEAAKKIEEAEKAEAKQAQETKSAETQTEITPGAKVEKIAVSATTEAKW